MTAPVVHGLNFQEIFSSEVEDLRKLPAIIMPREKMKCIDSRLHFMGKCKTEDCDGKTEYPDECDNCGKTFCSSCLISMDCDGHQHCEDWDCKHVISWDCERGHCGRGGNYFCFERCASCDGPPGIEGFIRSE